MSSNVKQGGLLSNKDLLTAFSRGIHLNGMNDYPAQMHSGYTYAMIPALKKIYKDDKEKRLDAYRRHMTEYFNVTPYVVGLPMGVTLALEEQNAQSDDFDTTTVTGVKTALMGPLSAIGDTIFHSTLRVIAVSVAVDLCMQGSFAGAVLFFLIFNVPQLLVRWWTLKMGYSMGTRFLEDAAATGVMDKISYAASVIGLAAIGAMTATNVALTTPITFGGAGETDPTALQALFDTVMPKMLPLLLVLACYWLLGKKKVNVVVLLIALIVVGVVLALCGIIG
ncbi:PTS system mannose/fructose/sorbose family transporter subunit IID [uncultured Enorma sp.]|uniref:PTS system mannose/fructose/sorbose family transporter subunit IID n=1 Tax=uncultured Enorma sp. TaxID=1714346 RepID=UPI0026390BD3|nr:PTS system mannose/fructose/sorbose family transporter subunit IID [uncultured Enorma sp.]